MLHKARECKPQVYTWTKRCNWTLDSKKNTFKLCNSSIRLRPYSSGVYSQKKYVFTRHCALRAHTHILSYCRSGHNFGVFTLNEIMPIAYIYIYIYEVMPIMLLCTNVILCLPCYYMEYGIMPMVLPYMIACFSCCYMWHHAPHAALYYNTPLYMIACLMLLHMTSCLSVLRYTSITTSNHARYNFNGPDTLFEPY